MRIVFYGIGVFFKRREQYIKDHINWEDVILADTNFDSLCSYDGKKIASPIELLELKYVKIVVTSIHYEEIYSQLVNIGVEKDKIISFSRFTREIEQGHNERFEVIPHIHSKGEVLLITSCLGFNGATWVLLYAAEALKKRQYNVTIVTDDKYDYNFIAEVKRREVELIIMRSLPYMGGADFNIIDRFDVVIVNVFQNMNVAYKMAGYKPAFWWIHECPDLFGESYYSDTIREHSDISDGKWLDEITVGAVSKVSKEAFDSFYPNTISVCMPYGIPDEKISNNILRNDNRIIFAVIGNVCQRKAQDLFVRSAKRIIDMFPGRCLFWIIGPYDSKKEYDYKVIEAINGEADIVLHGLKSREEINEMYQFIDVEVCSSQIECLQVVSVEGMMHGKICITTDATGMTEYIDDEVNGLIFKSGDEKSLFDKMKWVVENYENYPIMNSIRKKARKTYEEHFSMDAYADRLEKMIREISIKNTERRR